MVFLQVGRASTLIAVLLLLVDVSSGFTELDPALADFDPHACPAETDGADDGETALSSSFSAGVTRQLRSASMHVDAAPLTIPCQTQSLLSAFTIICAELLMSGQKKVCAGEVSVD
eukprot:1022040-Rhodomonas_salina.2